VQATFQWKLKRIQSFLLPSFLSFFFLLIQFFFSPSPRVQENPDVIVGTPGRLIAHLKEKNLRLTDALKFIVIDEADLIFSFGYEEDIQELMSFLPKVCQGFLMSATLSPVSAIVAR
jgi:superfamily II DNA/RNA helicase